MAKPLIVGLAPARSTSDAVTSSGRLAALLGWDRDELLARADWRNLLPGPIDGMTPLLRREAWDRVTPLWVRAGAEGRTTLVLLGREVARAFAFDGSQPTRLIRSAAWTVAVIPHPSGRNRWYNDPAHRALAASVLREVLT